MNSISGQADAIGQAAGGPVLGLVGNRFGTGGALGLGALLLMPALALYARDPPRRPGSGARGAPGGGVVIRRAETAADLDTYARVWSQVHPDLPISGEEVRRRVAKRDDGRQFLLAEAEGRAVGTGYASRTSVKDRAAALVSVLPATVAGSALLALRWGSRRASAHPPRRANSLRITCRGRSAAGSRRSTARSSSSSP